MRLTDADYAISGIGASLENELNREQSDSLLAPGAVSSSPGAGHLDPHRARVGSDRGHTGRRMSAMTQNANLKRRVRALMLETGTNYTTALRLHEAALANLHAEDAAASELPGPIGEACPPAAAVPAASDSTLNLQFSGAPDLTVAADRPE